MSLPPNVHDAEPIPAEARAEIAQGRRAAPRSLAASESTM